MYEGARVSLSISGAPYPLPLESESDVLYIAQQAVSNAIEHGHAEHVGIELEYAPERFALWVRDDGKGFPAARTSEAGHYGMAMMRERAQRIGGTLIVESAPEAGTEIGVAVDRRRAPKERTR
jgi:signal transduction histidine kinase